MARFKYTVVTKDGRKLNGNIDSASEQTARQELNALGFSIISINEVDETNRQETSGTTLYEFEALDQKQKKIVGTIPAQEKYAAYKRLQLEYKFTVLSLCKAAASSYEKQQEKDLGIVNMQSKLQEELRAQASKQTTNQVDQQASIEDEAAANQVQEDESVVLQHQIDILLAKTKELITKYEQQIPPEEKQEITEKLNKLLRIKNSTNMTYVRESAKSLLETLQRQEVLMVNKQHDINKSKLKFDIMQLTNKIKKQESEISWREKQIKKTETWILQAKQNPAPSIFQKIALHAAEFWLSAIKEPEEIRKLRQEEFILKKQVNDYKAMQRHEPDPVLKAQIKSSLFALEKQKKEITQKISTLKRTAYTNEQVAKPENLFISLLSEFYTFTGWLLAFYLMYYFVGIYISTKDFGITNIPVSLRVYDSAFFKYFLTILFVMHGSTSIKIQFLRYNAVATFIIFPTSFILIMLILFNF